MKIDVNTGGTDSQEVFSYETYTLGKLMVTLRVRFVKQCFSMGIGPSELSSTLINLPSTTLVLY